MIFFELMGFASLGGGVARPIRCSIWVICCAIASSTLGSSFGCGLVGSDERRDSDDDDDDDAGGRFTGGRGGTRPLGGSSGDPTGGIGTGGAATGGTAAGGTAAGGVATGGASNGGSATGGTATGGTATGGSGQGGEGGSPVVIPTCVEGCRTNADCGTGTAADGPANYACENGGCVRLGCQSDEECNAQAAGRVCRPYPGVMVNICNVPCTSRDVCGVATSATFGPDNYECTEGTCIHMGCLSNEECEADYGATYPGMRCLATNGYASCVLPCSTAADCALGGGTNPSYDADNYVCRDGACFYTGCLSDAECASAVPDTVCRAKVYGP